MASIAAKLPHDRFGVGRAGSGCSVLEGHEGACCPIADGTDGTTDLPSMDRDGNLVRELCVPASNGPDMQTFRAAMDRTNVMLRGHLADDVFVFVVVPEI
jgi:hypothetical protein